MLQLNASHILIYKQQMQLMLKGTKMSQPCAANVPIYSDPMQEKERRVKRLILCQ